MALQSSGTITIQDIATEFGGTTPHSLSEYYDAAGGVPASGTISISDFYGTSSFGVEFLQTALAVGSASSTHTFSNVNFGTAGASRWIFVTVHDGQGAYADSVTIGGVTATLAVRSSTNYQTCEIYYAKVTTGSSGNVVVSSYANEKSIGVWRVITGATNPVANTALYGEGSTNATVTIPTGGVAIATNCYDNSSGSITPGTERYSHDGGTSEWVNGNDTATTGETGSTTFNGSGSDALAVVAITP